MSGGELQHLTLGISVYSLSYYSSSSSMILSRLQQQQQYQFVVIVDFKKYVSLKVRLIAKCEVKPN